MELAARHRRTVAVGLAVAVVANLVYAFIVPLGDSAAERLDASASDPGLAATAAVLDVVFRISLSVALVSLLAVIRERVGLASAGVALVVGGSIASVLVDLPYLVWAQAPDDAAGRQAVLDAVDGVTGGLAFLSLTIGGLLVLTAGATALLLALRPPGWAPTWVLVAFLAGGVASLAGANVRAGLVAGALLVGSALGYIALQVARSGQVAPSPRPDAVPSGG